MTNETDYEEPKVFVVGKTSKRILAGLCDYFIIVFVAMVFYSLLVNIVTQGPLASTASNAQSLVVDEQEKSFLVERNNKGELKSHEQMKFTYAKKQAFYDGTGTPEDSLYKFYCCYEAQEGKNLWNVADFNAKVLKVGEADSIFVANGDNVAYLKEEIRLPLQTYVTAEKPEETKEAEPLNAFRAVSDFYDKAHTEAWKTLMLSQPIYDNFVTYTSNATTFYLALTSIAIVSYVLSCAIFLYLVPAIHKKGSTIGKKMMKLEPVGKEGAPLSWSQIFLRSTMDLFVYSSCLPFVPMFIYGVDGFTMPLIAIGSFVINLSAFFIFGLLFAVASLLFVAIRKDHLSLSGMISHSQVCTTDMTIIAAEKEKIRQAKEQEGEGGKYGR